jgi:hypothetical protein
MKRIILSLCAAVFALFAVAGNYAYAQTPVIAQTWVGGTIKDGSGNPIPGGGSGDNVTVICNGNVQVVPFNASGNYGAIFPQTQCKVGDSATAAVAIAEGSGSNTGTVENTTVNGPIVDLDVVVLDITVPEFGLVGGMAAGGASIAGYLLLRAKSTLS